MAAGRGGYCFEQNTLLRRRPRGAGLPHHRAGGPGAVGTTRACGRAPTCSCASTCPRGRSWPTSGFGGDGFVLPVPLAAAGEAWAGRDGSSRGPRGRPLRPAGEPRRRWTDLYAFTLEPQIPVGLRDGEPLHEHLPALALPAEPDRAASVAAPAAILRNRDLVSREGGKATAASVRDPDHLLEVLDRGVRPRVSARAPASRSPSSREGDEP